MSSEPRRSAAHHFIDGLQEAGIEHLFSNLGTDHVSLIDSRLALHRRRADKLYRLVAERPRTGYELAVELWGNVAVTQAFLTLSEVIGHLDLLINEGRVREVADGEVVRYAATGTRAQTSDGED